MTTHPVTRPTADTVHVSINAHGCEHCVTALATNEPEPVRLTTGRTALVTAVTDCPNDDAAVSVALDGSTLTIRYTFEDPAALSSALSALAYGGGYRANIATEMFAMLADLPAWGVRDDMAAEDAVEALTRAIVWAASGESAAFMHQWVGAGAKGPREATSWTMNDTAIEDATAWMTVGVETAWQAKEFTTAGIDASQVSTTTSDPRTFAFVHAGGLDPQRDYYLLNTFATIGFAQAAEAQGVPSTAATRLALLMGPIVAALDEGDEVTFGLPGLMFRSRWGSEQEDTFKEFARDLDGLDWNDACECLRAGLSLTETVEHLRSGADMGPVKVTAALTPVVLR